MRKYGEPPGKVRLHESLVFACRDLHTVVWWSPSGKPEAPRSPSFACRAFGTVRLSSPAKAGDFKYGGFKVRDRKPG